jgi:hypothetical protein
MTQNVAMSSETMMSPRSIDPVPSPELGSAFTDGINVTTGNKGSKRAGGIVTVAVGAGP